MADEEGISRCGISGLFDDRGNPAALASGWLQAVEKNGRRRHRYFVLAPTYLAYFNSEDHANISEEGFLQGDADHDSLAAVATHGVSIGLLDIETIAVEPPESQFILVHLRDGVVHAEISPQGNVLKLECSSADIASGWHDAIVSQIDRVDAVELPPRLPPPEVDASVEADSVYDLARPPPSRAPTSMLSSLFGGAPREAARLDDEYFAIDSWTQERGIDLASKAGAAFLDDGRGHPAAVVHGWLTKRNKSGVAAGKTEKERYFVLTPQALCFFKDERAADIQGGYMMGRADGTRVGLLGRTGGRMALEAVCEVRLLAHGGGFAKTTAITGRGASSRQRKDFDDEDEDEDDAGPKALAAKKRASSSRSLGGSGGGGGEDGALSRKSSKKLVTKDDDGLDALTPKAIRVGQASDLFEIDFGTVSLVVNAHNQRCRQYWVKQLRKWSVLRKRAADEAMFNHYGTAMTTARTGEDD